MAWGQEKYRSSTIWVTWLRKWYYIDLLSQNHILPSLSGRGKPTDNAKAENFFKPLKYDQVYLKEYDSFDDAKANIQRFIEQLYNTKPLHSALGYLSPSEFENQYHLNQGLLAQGCLLRAACSGLLAQVIQY